MPFRRNQHFTNNILEGSTSGEGSTFTLKRQVCHAFLSFYIKYLQNQVYKYLFLLEKLGFVFKVGIWHFTGIFSLENEGLIMGRFSHFLGIFAFTIPSATVYFYASKQIYNYEISFSRSN
jgi:hypothetical protein